MRNVAGPVSYSIYKFIGTHIKGNSFKCKILKVILNETIKHLIEIIMILCDIIKQLIKATKLLIKKLKFQLKQVSP